VWFAKLGTMVKNVKRCVGYLGKKLSFMMNIFSEVDE
jgi:hypothetical protein